MSAELKPFQLGDLVRFASEQNGGPVHRVVSVMSDGMIELHDFGGYFAPHLFVVADDIADIPAGERTPSPSPDVAGLVRRLINLDEHLSDQPLTHCDSQDRSTIREAATELTRLSARVRELESELDTWKSVFPDIAPANVIPDRSVLEARVKALEEGLEPFGQIADGYDDAEDDNFEIWKDFDVLGASLPLRIFRRARGLLNKGDRHD